MGRFAGEKDCIGVHSQEQINVNSDLIWGEKGSEGGRKSEGESDYQSPDLHKATNGTCTSLDINESKLGRA